MNEGTRPRHAADFGPSAFEALGRIFRQFLYRNFPSRVVRRWKLQSATRFQLPVNQPEASYAAPLPLSARIENWAELTRLHPDIASLYPEPNCDATVICLSADAAAWLRKLPR